MQIACTTDVGQWSCRESYYSRTSTPYIVNTPRHYLVHLFIAFVIAFGTSISFGEFLVILSFVGELRFVHKSYVVDFEKPIPWSTTLMYFQICSRTITAIPFTTSLLFRPRHFIVMNHLDGSKKVLSLSVSFIELITIKCYHAVVNTTGPHSSLSRPLNSLLLDYSKHFCQFFINYKKTQKIFFPHPISWFQINCRISFSHQIPFFSIVMDIFGLNYMLFVVIVRLIFPLNYYPLLRDGTINTRTFHP